MILLKNNVFALFASFQNVILWNILVNIKKKILQIKNCLHFYLQKKKQAYWVVMCVEAFLLHEKIWLIFVWLTFTLFFCKAIVKDAVKQMLGFLGCWFFKHDIWTRCKKCNVCVNFCGFPLFPLFLNFDFLCIYGFSKIIKFLSSGGSLFL